MVKEYSLKNNGNESLRENFRVFEFACKDGSDKILIDSYLVYLLQKVRNYFGKPVHITSAYRNKEYNKKIGGTSLSQHINGKAADIMVENVLPKDVAIYLESLVENEGGIGLYPNFVHIDTRSKRARWQNFGKEKNVKGFYEKDYLNPTDAISVLIKKGIISDGEKWYSGTWTDQDFKWLLRKVGTYLNSI